MEKDYMKLVVEVRHLQSTIDNLDMGDMTLDEWPRVFYQTKHLAALFKREDILHQAW